MPFIGNQPALSYTSFAKQDFTTSATTSYTLDNPVANANELALFINFVRQEPTTAYSASGTSLTLTSATSATDDMYCVFLGKAVQTVTPANNSVTNAMTAFTKPTITRYTSGTGTYNLPSGAKHIQVTLIGAGGGGAGGGSAGTMGSGSAGGNTTFGSSYLTSNGGSGGGTNWGSGGTGGTTSITSATGDNTFFNFTGGQGGFGNFGSSGTSFSIDSGAGGNSFLGVGAIGGNYVGGAGSPVGYGAGGGGGSRGSSSSLRYGGRGGGAGGSLKQLITQPSSSYSYAVGSGGSGGSAGTDGGAGSTGTSGIIIIEEFYV